MSLPWLLNTTVDHYRQVETSKDSSGGPVLDLDPVAQAIPAYVNELSGQQRLQYAMLQESITHEIVTLYDAVINGDRLRLDTGSWVRVEYVRRIRGMGGIPTYFVIEGEQVKSTE